MNGKELYPNLFKPLHIKSLQLKNRFIEAPMGTFSEEVNGYPSLQQIEYYRTRAKGGFALIIPEAQFVISKTEAWIAHQTIVGTADQMHGWLAITEAVHSEGVGAWLRPWARSSGIRGKRNSFCFRKSALLQSIREGARPHDR